MKITNAKPQAIVAISPDLCRSAHGSRLLQLSGNNTGNLFFTEAVYSQVRSPQHAGFHFNPDAINSKFSSLVIPAANWVNNQEDLTPLYERIARVKIPICCVGLGSQLTPQQVNLTSNKFRFLATLSQKSALIGVRDFNTKSILSSMGIDNTLVVGCPSMFFSMRSLRAPRLNETTKLDRLNIGFTRFSINDADMNGAQQKLAALAASTANHIIIQSEREEFMLKNREKIETSELQKLQLYYSCNSTKQISNLIEHKIKIFNSTSTWTDFLCKNCDLTVSSRIHGCIASLNAGKPALLLHHDVRTSELAKVIGIPSIPIEGALKPNAAAFRKNIIYLLNSLKNDDLFESCQARNLSALKKVYASNKISVNMR